MSAICISAESCFDYSKAYYYSCRERKLDNIRESMASSATQMVFELGIKIIIVFTAGGESARLLAKYRPDAFIIAVSTDITTIKSLCLSYGVIALRVPSF